MPGGSRRNLDWVAPHTDTGGLAEEDLLLLADAQTSGGLLIAGEIPGAPVIGELVPPRGRTRSSCARPGGLSTPFPASAAPPRARPAPVVARAGPTSGRRR